jgi:hypothetical protein
MSVEFFKRTMDSNNKSIIMYQTYVDELIQENLHLSEELLKLQNNEKD